MLKKLLLLVALIAFFSGVYAAAFLVSPVQREITDNGITEIGSVSPGETAELFFRKKSGEGFDWQSISIDDATLPDGWEFSSTANADSISLRLFVPADAAESTQLLGFRLESDGRNLPFTGKFFVKRNLLAMAIPDLNRKSVVGEKVPFRLVAVNDSIAMQRVSVSSTLPDYWMKPKTFEIGPKESKELAFDILPRTYGERNFKFSAKSDFGSARRDFSARLVVSPTLQSKFSAPIFGFPFFSPTTLLPYAVNSVLSLIS